MKISLWTAWLVLLGACAQLPASSGCSGERMLYVVSHGWHSGIVVESAELAKRLPALQTGDAKYLEIGWGEARFYQARETNAWMALRAVLGPNPSVLQVVPLAEPLAGSEVVEVRTDESGYEAVLDFISGAFKPDLQRLGPSLYGSGWFYPAHGSFHLFNTCNDWVARALAQAGCR